MTQNWTVALPRVTQVIMLWLTMTIFSTVQAVNMSVLNKISYPKYECLTLPPVNQYYYPFMFAFDTDYYDICNVDSFPIDVGKILNTSSCLDYLCPKENKWNLGNSTQRQAVSFVFNHCMYCNNSQAEDFREMLSNDSCPALSDFNLAQVMNFHCNGGWTEGGGNLPLLESSFFSSDYFLSEYRKWYVQNGTMVDMATAIGNVTLQQLFKFYFRKYPDLRQAGLTAPLDVPFTCWCNYEQQSTSYGFQCGDFYQAYQVPFVYRYSVIFYFVFYSLLTVFILVLVLIPRCVERVKLYQERTDIALLSPLKRDLMFIPHLFDIVIQPPIFFFLSGAAGFFENFFRFLFNFAAFEGFYNAYFPGVCRGICALFMVCGYSSLVISWSHVIDMSKMKQGTDNKGKRKNGLSVFNKTVLTIFYVGVIVVLFLSAVVYAATGSYGSAWIVLSSAVLFYLLTFGAGFAFYGVKIMISLRASAQNRKQQIMEYRFTKFILAQTTLFLLGWIVTLLALMTYILGFDGLSLFYGITRNVFIDASLSSVIFLSPYIMFNEDAFGMVYGKKAQAMWNSIFSGGCKQSESHEEVPKTPSATPHIASESTISRVDSAPESTFTSTPVDTTPTASVLV